MPNILITESPSGEVVAVTFDFHPAAINQFIQPPINPGFVTHPGMTPGIGFAAPISAVAYQLIAFDSAVTGIKKSTVLSAQQKTDALGVINGFRPGDAIYFDKASPSFLEEIAALARRSSATIAGRINPGLVKLVDP